MSESKRGWIRHRGGAAPVAGYVRVIVKKRNGDQFGGVADECQWNHFKHHDDVMQWKLAPVEQEPAKFDPVALRDRYEEIHAKQFELSAQISELDEEKDGIVATLKSEGFALVGV